MFFVYAIRSTVRQYVYVGMTSNIDKRLQYHNHGYERTTKPYSPFELILKESYPSRQLARQREKYLKSGVGREFLAGII
ncbi:MAG: GIY-YIG nuclease family protein [Cyclobacteriaceae bacterium]|nr:GIY-YIG nuclease family protein [Cyclobacteriaceae bacterium]